MDKLAPSLMDHMRSILKSPGPSDEELAKLHAEAAEDRERQKRELAEQRAERRRERARAALPGRFQRIDWAHFDVSDPAVARGVATARAWARGFLRGDRRNLLLYGSTGTGKTACASAAMLEALEAGFAARYFTEADAINFIREGYGDRSGPDRIGILADLDLLVLDEIGVVDGDPTKRQAVVFQLIDARYRQDKPTLFVTNLDTESALVSYLGDRCVDRIVEGCVRLKFVWPSFRRRRQ